MSRAKANKDEVQQMVRAAPFRPFAMNMENGDRIIIEHPENIAFEPESDEGEEAYEFYVILRRLRQFSNFDAVTSVAMVDRGAIAK